MGHKKELIFGLERWQGGECLPSKHEALHFNPSTAKKNEEEGRGGGGGE
jgi:hypothetical protein